MRSFAGAESVPAAPPHLSGYLLPTHFDSFQIFKLEFYDFKICCFRLCDSQLALYTSLPDVKV